MFGGSLSSAQWAGGRCPQSGARRALHRAYPAPVGRGPARPRSLRSRPATVGGASGERLSGGAPRSLSLPLRVPLRFLIPRSLRSLGIFKATDARGLRNQRHGCYHAVMISNLPLRPYALERHMRPPMNRWLRHQNQTHPPPRNKKGGVHCHTP